MEELFDDDHEIKTPVQGVTGPEITSWEVQGAIGRQKVNKSPGSDQINAGLLKLFDKDQIAEQTI